MKKITKKLFSLCVDFNPDEGYEEMYDDLSEATGCDCYIDYTAMTKETEIEKGYPNDPVSNRLVELGAEDGEKVLIHIDY